MTEIKLEINSCADCPFLKRERIYTADSFERPERWTCGKAEQEVCGYVEWNDKVEIPEWCPAKV